MSKYKYHSATKHETAWIESPNGGEVGDLMDITEELNLLLHSWKEKCIEADTMRQHYENAESLLSQKKLNCSCDNIGSHYSS